jgi:hypothetical protein
MPQAEACQCAFCKNNMAFSIPEHLLQELRRGNVVVFAGAGISTENRDSAQDTFYDRVATELNVEENLSFPALMQRFCDRPDGRINLIRKIKDRFDYFLSFDDFMHQMSRFHKSIGPLYPLKDVITTNWDDFFERVCDFDAFVADSDMAFWQSSERRLMKIHGSIRSPGSIVATDADYRNSFRRLSKGPMGAVLKSLLAQKTLIYSGYSLSDGNYRKLADIISKMMKPHDRAAYYLSPKIDREILEKFPIKLIPIETDGAFCFEQLRKHCESDDLITHEAAFDFADDLLHDVIEAHHRTSDAFKRRQCVLLPFSLSYQDGLIHALERIKRLRMSGHYHDPGNIANLIRGYESRKSEFRKKHDYWNASYADGYGGGILYLAIAAQQPKLKPPLYGGYGNVEFHSLSSLLRYPTAKISQRYVRQARKILDRVASGESFLIPQHTPCL